MLNSVKNLILSTFIFAFCFNAKANIDTLFSDASKIFHFHWSLGDHLSEEIIFNKDTNIFLHTFREHLLVVQIFGVYEMKGDSSFVLKCTSGCNERIKSLPPIIFPTDTLFNSDTLPVFNSGMQIISNSYAIQKKTNQRDSLFIYINNELFSKQLMSGQANSYKVILPSEKDYYIESKGFKKTGFIKNGNLTLEGKLFPKPKMVVVDKKKKRRRFRKKN